MKYHIINKDNIIALKNYPDNYFDSVVTDPPYGLGKEPNAVELMKDWVEKGYYEIKGTGFMGKEWDAFVPQPLFWKEVFRVLKPGGHCLAFYGTRTYDWGVMAMRFAGFEVRDCIQWIYGSGFPKSHNIGKAIDKLNGNEREVVGKGVSGSTSKGFNLNEQQREAGTGILAGEYNLTKGNSEWEGWGSALKPANEPIVLARKPLEKGLSIAENVLKWGTGGINIDGCRIGYSKDDHLMKYEGYQNGTYKSEYEEGTSYKYGNQVQINPTGRFPANIILDEEAAKILDEQSGISKSSDTKRNRNTLGSFGMPNDETPEYNDKGGASRFFYVAKASKSERNSGLENFDKKQTVGGGGGIGNYLEDVNSSSGKYGSEKAPNKNFHPTVKPVKLMQYLARLITPPNGKVLDPFCGSGTTGVACKIEGFMFVGIEQDTEYCKIAEARIKNTKQDINLFNCV